tara:strand:- start:597 stop:1949 length:1353 start_codon:yes stop_codon:yes gene_type:complete
MSKINILKLGYLEDTSIVYDLIHDHDWPIYLCSNNKIFPDHKYDIITAQPREKIFFYNDKTIIEKNGKKITSTEEPIYVLKDLMKKYKNDNSDLPFTGGAIGYISYDHGARYENISQKYNDFNIPSFAFGLYDWAYIADHDAKQSCLIYHEKNSFIKSIIDSLNSYPKNQNKYFFKIKSKCESNTTYNEYKKKFDKIKRYIEEGDCYQINFSQRFSAKYEGDCYSIFKKLNKVYASPYTGFINFPFIKIMTFSPECFISQNKEHVSTKPIKGTRPISKDSIENKKIIDELLNSDKDKAENLMIVDLLRNDFGRNCKYGSVSVENLFDVETFSNVHHLVSTVNGTISNNSDIYSLLKGCFPGGSITGAPKIRAMQIIDEIECSNRGIYCGSIGYISGNDKSNLNIAIRTIFADDNTLYFWGGGGIVYDSEVELEYKETLDKVRPLLDLFKA